MSSLIARLRTALRTLSVLDEVDLAFELLNPGSDQVIVDVGAHEGGSLQKFADRGCTVHAFEPDPRNMATLSERWARNANVYLNASAVGAWDAEKVSFAVSSNSYIGSLTSFDSSHTDGIEVPLVTLASYIQRHNIHRLDFLKVDAEGHDMDVLRGFPWDVVKPRVVVCEFEDAKLGKPEIGFEAMADFLMELGYSVLVSEWHPIVSYAGPFRWRRFFSYPGTIPNPKGNGNIVAVRTQADWTRLRVLCFKKLLATRLARKVRAMYRWLRTVIG